MDSTSAAPYRILDRRGTNSGGRNDLYEPATVSQVRQQVRSFDRDIHDLVSSDGRRQMMTTGRWLFANFPAVHGMVLEQANLAVGSWIPQFEGEDKEWGEEAETWLYEWHKIMDFRGWPFDYGSFVQFQIIATLRCGDIGTLLVNGPSGYPFVQIIPAHRIGSSTSQKFVNGGRYDGSRIIDGVIVDDFSRAQAYRVWQRSVGLGEYDDIPAQNMALTYFPKWPEQVRGISDLAAGLGSWQDVKEARFNELIAQKAASAVAIIETNETGEADSAKNVIKTSATRSSAGDLTSPGYEELAGGTIRYLRANSGAGISTLQHSRPGFSAIEFLENCMRDAFSAAEWDYYFSVNPTKLGSGALRVVVDRINRVIKKRRAMVEKVCRRVDGWAIAKAVKLGLLPANDDWFRWSYQGPADVTADRKYDSDVDIQEVNAGFRTLQDVCARRSMWWEEVQDQRLVEEKREKEKRTEMGLDPKPDPEATPIPNRQPREADADKGKQDEGDKGDKGDNEKDKKEGDDE